MVVNTLIIGRSPITPGEFPGAELVEVNDITVSKSHAAVGRNGAELCVGDLGSSNGVTIDDGTGERRIQPQAVVPLARGNLVVLGDDTYFVVVGLDVVNDGAAVESTLPRSFLPGPS